MTNETLLSVATVVGTWAAVFGALFAVWRQNVVAQRLARIQLSFQLSAQYDSELMQRIRSRVARQILEDPTFTSIDDTLLLFLENVAQLHRRRLLDPVLVFNVFGFDIPYHWLAHRRYIEKLREQYSDNSLYEELEQMSRQLARKQRSALGCPVPALDESTDAVRSFLRMEALRSPETARRRTPLNRARVKRERFAADSRLGRRGGADEA